MIGSVNYINFTKQFNRNSFCGEKKSSTVQQIENLPDVRPDFNVKTPMAYTKTDEIDFPYNTKAHCYKLANGQKIVIVPQDGETVLRTYVNTGSMNEPDNLRGISHYIEHNLFNGSKGLEEGDFFNQVNKMGADTNASTDFAETNYYISSNLLNETDLENKIRLHASMIETPVFALDKLEKEKGIVNSEINMITSYPDNLALSRMIKNLYGIKSTSADLVGGTTDNITNLTRDDVVNYFNNNYYPANMVTVITGDVKPDETMQLISKYFSSNKKAPASRYYEKLTPIQKTVREDLISDKATASGIYIGFNGPVINNEKDIIYSKAIMCILSSSLTSRIDKKIKDFGSRSDFMIEKVGAKSDDGRTLIFVSDSKEKDSEKVFQTMFNEISNFVNNPPTDDEMQIVKKQLLQAHSNIYENSFRTNNAIGEAILDNNLSYLNNFEQIVNSMTASDLVETAKKYFDTSKASVTIIHPNSATKDSIEENYKNTSNTSNISFTGAKKEAVDMSKVKLFDLPNNYRVITNNSKTDKVSVLLKIESNEKYYAKPAASLVLDKLLEEGSLYRSQDEFQIDMAKKGIGLDAGAKSNSISSTVVCDVDDISDAMKMMKEVVENPRFNETDFQKVKVRIKNRIETTEKFASEKLDAELFKGLPKGFSKEEILKSLETLTLDDVKYLYSDIMKNGDGSVCMVAPFDRKPELQNEMFSNVANFKTVNKFSPQKIEKFYKPVTQTKVLTDVDNKNQAEILEVFTFKNSQNLKDIAALNLLNIILGGNASSRLFTDLRETQKLAYHVNSSYTKCEDTGMFSLKIKTTTDNSETGEKSYENIQKSIDGFNKHIAKIRSEKVTEDELANAKLNLKNEILNENQNSFDKAISVLKGIKSPYGASRENQLFAEIDKITTDDILNAAKYVFSNKPTYSILATENTLKSNEEYFSSLEK